MIFIPGHWTYKHFDRHYSDARTECGQADTHAERNTVMQSFYLMFCFADINGQCDSSSACSLLYNAQPTCIEIGTMSLSCVCINNQNQQIHCEDIPCKFGIEAF